MKNKTTELGKVISETRENKGISQQNFILKQRKNGKNNSKERPKIKLGEQQW